jgi:hypothetical protein
MTNVVSSQPLKWHGGKSYLASWLHSLAPPACMNARDSNDGFGYTHRNIVFAGGLGEFWNWLPYEGISETVNDANGPRSAARPHSGGARMSDKRTMTMVALLALSTVVSAINMALTNGPPMPNAQKAVAFIQFFSCWLPYFGNDILGSP